MSNRQAPVLRTDMEKTPTSSHVYLHFTRVVTIAPTFSACNLTSKPLQLAPALTGKGEQPSDPVNFIPQDLPPKTSVDKNPSIPEPRYEPLLFWSRSGGENNPEGHLLEHHLALSSLGSPWSKAYRISDHFRQQDHEDSRVSLSGMVTTLFTFTL